MKSFCLPQDLILGSATSGCQIESGDKNSNWYNWCLQGHTKDQSSCISTCNHYQYFEEDIRLMQILNQESYRMSIEWSRIEPKQGEYCIEALNHYRKELCLLKKARIRPVVTLHHFAHPIWFEEKGGFYQKEGIKYFLKYVEYIVKELGDLVTDWITINEPNVYAVGGYYAGRFPPGDKSFLRFFRVSKNLVKAHILAYNKIHTIMSRKHLSSETKVGVAYHIAYIDPHTQSLYGRFIYRLIQYVFHDLFIQGTINGNFLFPSGGSQRYGQKGKKYCDFIGINYYARHFVKVSWNPRQFFGSIEFDENGHLNDLGWEIYPQGLFHVCKRIYAKYKLPIFITENGTCDEKDAFRAKFIYDHLYQVKRLRDEQVPIERYYYWSTMDNFEWEEGLKVRFGLIHVDYETQKRTIRDSAYFYREIIKNKAVTENMIERYLTTEERCLERLRKQSS